MCPCWRLIATAYASDRALDSPLEADLALCADWEDERDCDSDSDVPTVRPTEDDSPVEDDVEEDVPWVWLAPFTIAWLWACEDDVPAEVEREDPEVSLAEVPVDLLWDWDSDVEDEVPWVCEVPEVRPWVCEDDSATELDCPLDTPWDSDVPVPDWVACEEWVPYPVASVPDSELPIMPMPALLAQALDSEELELSPVLEVEDLDVLEPELRLSEVLDPLVSVRPAVSEDEEDSDVPYELLRP